MAEVQIDLSLVNDYQDKYVAFLDLLGFAALVDKAGGDVLERHRVVEALKLVRDTLTQDPKIDFRFTYFPDCIVLSAVKTPHALWAMFQAIELLTFNLLQYDIFVRGGLTSGMLHHSDDFVFGTAMTEAYHLERDHADGPLVLAPKTILKDATELGADFTQWLRQDGSDRFFVDYLMRYAEYKQERLPGTVVLTYPAARIAYFVSKRLCNDEELILQKAEWFQRYWNSRVATQGFLPEIVADATLELSDDGPTIIFRRLMAPVVSLNGSNNPRSEA
jgi:hypothetical protein